MKNKGFTLIELMIVIAIISILASVAIPRFADLITKAKCHRNGTSYSYEIKKQYKTKTANNFIERFEAVYGAGSAKHTPLEDVLNGNFRRKLKGVTSNNEEQPVVYQKTVISIWEEQYDDYMRKAKEFADKAANGTSLERDNNYKMYQMYIDMAKEIREKNK